MHHTKEKGDLAVLKVQADLASKGYMVLHPLTEHAPFDIVGYKKQKFLRVQVKYASCKKSGVVHISFTSHWADRHGTHRRFMNKKDVDAVAIYCPETNECY